MTYKGTSILAVVPARGGSKGIPRKNLAKVGGTSLIGWAARTVADLPWIDAAVLSTDDEEMAAEGKACGLEVPFMRPDEFATDGASSVGMWQHAWRESERAFGRVFDVSVLLQPTTPLRQPDDVRRCVDAVVEDGHRAATTVSRVPGHFTPEKTLSLDDDGVIEFIMGDRAVHGARQAIPAYHYRNGICYAVTRETLLDHGHIVEDDCVGVEIDRFIVNIDEPFELELAEFMLDKERRNED